jgi:hypothetical protein
MTAYELAEKAEGLAYEIPADWSSGEPKNVATDIANMLRQQADLLNKYEKRNVELQAKITKLLDRIEELEKPHKYDPETGEPLIDGYPLFSGLPRPQTKPLSDEEICNLWIEHSYGVPLSNISFEFARAIEERHGIK